ncbi:MAG: hypothetical protein WC889_17685 [Myxococcota bacterium]
MTGRNTIDCLLFEVAGIAFGADAAQIARIDNAPVSGDDVDAVSFRAALGIGKGEVSGGMSLLRMKGPGAASLLVDRLEAIVPIGAEELHPLPGMLREVAANPYLKAVALHKGKVILIVDLVKVASMVEKRRSACLEH